MIKLNNHNLYNEKILLASALKLKKEQSLYPVLIAKETSDPKKFLILRDYLNDQILQEIFL